MEQKNLNSPSQICVISKIWSLKNSCTSETNRPSKYIKKVSNASKFRSKKRAQKRRRAKENESKGIKEDKSNKVLNGSEYNSLTSEQSSSDDCGSLAEDVPQKSRSTSPNDATRSLSVHTTQRCTKSNGSTLVLNAFDHRYLLKSSLPSLKESIPTKPFSPSTTHSLKNSLPTKESVSAKSFLPSSTCLPKNTLPSKEPISEKSFPPSTTDSVESFFPPFDKSIPKIQFPPSKTYSLKHSPFSTKKSITTKSFAPKNGNNSPKKSLPVLKESILTKSMSSNSHL